MSKAKTDSEMQGIECPGCGCRHMLLVERRDAPKGMERRRRECRNCGRRITTYEFVASDVKPAITPKTKGK